MKPDWFPDWSGSVCAIVACGPSVTSDDVDRLRGRAKVVVINRSHELAPWAGVLYAADRQFWDAFNGVPAFGGLRVTQDKDAANHFRLKLVSLVEQSSIAANGVSLDPAKLARGGHSGHQALNLAIQFSAKRILLVGFDFEGEHWHGSHVAPLRNARQTSMDRWRQRFDALAPMLDKLEIDVVNCSQHSRLMAYRKLSVEEALQRWSTTAKAA